MNRAVDHVTVTKQIQPLFRTSEPRPQRFCPTRLSTNTARKRRRFGRLSGSRPSGKFAAGVQRSAVAPGGDRAAREELERPAEQRGPKAPTVNFRSWILSGSQLA